MPRKPTGAFSVGLDAADQRELQKMIDEVRQNRQATQATAGQTQDSIQEQIDAVRCRVADLTDMVLKLEHQIAPLIKIMQLTHQKSERLSQRLDAVISALKKEKRID
jgi:SMC interacting uncharacterized protein involved in chromosome segregation